MPSPLTKKQLSFLHRKILRRLEASLSSNSLDLIDTPDYRDIFDFALRPDPNEEPEFAPRKYYPSTPATY